MIYEAIKQLVQYGIEKDLITPQDINYSTNRLLEILHLDEYVEPEQHFENINLESVLKEILHYAIEKGLIENSIVYRDLFDTKLMSVLVPPPHDVIEKFKELYLQSPEAATNWYYKFSQDTDYIRRYRIEKDLRWQTETEYGLLDLSINLSKPEKDPKAIAAAKSAKQSSYPQCMLCPQNEGYSGRANHPARQNHRIIPLELDGENWFLQYSPYVYYNEHCIILNCRHVPMVINKNTFKKLFDFIKLFPHYFVGSNADLPIVGGSILTHDHFQGGHFEFAMERAEIEHHFTIKNYEDIEVGIVKWPMSVIRMRHENPERLTQLAEHILNKWKNYTDKDAFIFAQTNGEPHNTITPIARKKENIFELDLVLRNNITTDEYPLGVFHPHKELHHIKKENIGLIEVMGLAVLPARLEKELKETASCIINKTDLRGNELTAKHADWVESFINKYPVINNNNVMQIIQQEVGNTFVKILECSGVFKRNKKGYDAFVKFINIL